jgi:hypothetical protein
VCNKQSSVRRSAAAAAAAASAAVRRAAGNTARRRLPLEWDALGEHRGRTESCCRRDAGDRCQRVSVTRRVLPLNLLSAVHRLSHTRRMLYGGTERANFNAQAAANYCDIFYLQMQRRGTVGDITGKTAGFGFKNN